MDILDAQEGTGPVPLLDGEASARLLADTHRIAMVGASADPDRPSHGVMRYQNVILGGIFAGLAGAWFTLDYGNSFQTGMTNGKGFIALAALIFGRWHPLGAFGAALLFAAAGSMGTAIRTTPPTGQLGQLLTSIPEQVFAALPYVVTIIVLAGVVGRSTPPAADGQPYQREATT